MLYLCSFACFIVGTFAVEPARLSIYIYYYYYYYYYVISYHRTYLPGTSLEQMVIPTAQASSFRLHYFPNAV
jgi:hypothetical protein